MDIKYLAGVAAALLCGIVNNVGVLLQKKAVNDLGQRKEDKKFFRPLLKNPIWLVGIFLQVGVGTATFMLAQQLIGPALVPGLMAAGLIVLALGSVRLLGENLVASEYAGVGLMITGISLLGLSGLEVSTATVREYLASPAALSRIALFSTAMIICWTFFSVLSLCQLQRKGIILGFANGFLFSLSNFWVSPLVALALPVLTGRDTSLQLLLFAAASFILVASNLAAFSQIQYAFRAGQASNIIPVQQLSIQLTPILVYFWVFALPAPRRQAAVLMAGGAALIITAGFLLARGQARLEEIR